MKSVTAVVVVVVVVVVVIMLCGSPTRPRYGSCPFDRPSVLCGLRTQILKGVEKPKLM